MLRQWIGILAAVCVSISAIPAQAQNSGKALEKSIGLVLNNGLDGRRNDASLTVQGVIFPQGSISFADEILSYEPGSVAPSNPHRGADNALGQPDYDNRNSCASQAACSFVSLGSGGTLVARFTDNILTGSGNSDLDLWVFEVGPQVEDMFVEISADGREWHSVGSIGGGKSGVDIDAFGFGPSAAIRYVRLRDDPTKDGTSGPTVGADIDAIGAISTRSANDCECTENAAAPSASELKFGNVVFPQGRVSFADELVSLKMGSPAPSAPHARAANALGVPDYNNRASCSAAADCKFVSLGRGGSIVLRFTDNILTGSGNSDIDLWVFEVGPQVEHMAVDISDDGKNWHSVGSIGGGRSGVDIDAFGFGPASSFSYVRLTDDPNEGGQSGPTVGADIDAVGAISTRATTACDCSGQR